MSMWRWGTALAHTSTGVRCGCEQQRALTISLISSRIMLQTSHTQLASISLVSAAACPSNARSCFSGRSRSGVDGKFASLLCSRHWQQQQRLASASRQLRWQHWHSGCNQQRRWWWQRRRWRESSARACRQRAFVVVAQLHLLMPGCKPHMHLVELPRGLRTAAAIRSGELLLLAVVIILGLFFLLLAHAPLHCAPPRHAPDRVHLAAVDAVP